MKYKILTYIFSLLLVASFLVAPLASAQLLKKDGKEGVVDNMEGAGDGANYNTTGDLNNPLISEVMSTVITAFLSLLGIIFLIMIIIGGFNWMTAAGSDDKVASGRKTLIRGTVGLIIVVTAYIITAFVFKALGGVVGI